jgi:cholesterol oxidase
VREEPGPGYEYWPVTYEDLESHYERAEGMLGATPYPFDRAPYDTTPKTVAYKAAAEELGRDWFLPDLAVTFAPEPGAEPIPGEPIREERRNIHERTRQTCRLVGECDVGCNFGSKNSLDYNYLTAAWHAGAEIRTRHEVRGFEPPTAAATRSTTSSISPSTRERRPIRSGYRERPSPPTVSCCRPEPSARRT